MFLYSAFVQFPRKLLKHAFIMYILFNPSDIKAHEHYITIERDVKSFSSFQKVKYLKSANTQNTLSDYIQFPSWFLTGLWNSTVQNKMDIHYRGTQVHDISYVISNK